MSTLINRPRWRCSWKRRRSVSDSHPNWPRSHRELAITDSTFGRPRYRIHNSNRAPLLSSVYLFVLQPLHSCRKLQGVPPPNNTLLPSELLQPIELRGTQPGTTYRLKLLFWNATHNAWPAWTLSLPTGLVVLLFFFFLLILMFVAVAYKICDDRLAIWIYLTNRLCVVCCATRQRPSHRPI